MTIDLDTPRSRYVVHFYPVGEWYFASTQQQQARRAEEVGVTHVCRFDGRPPAWLGAAATARGYRAIQLGYTNARRGGRCAHETWGLVPLEEEVAP